MRFKKGLALLAGLALVAGTLGGCATEQVIETVAESSVVLRNDGRSATLVLGELNAGAERTAVLREIAEKYRADFPNTEIEVRAFEDPQELEAALQAGEVDIAEVRSADQASYVSDGLLLNLYEYMKVWDERATLTPAAVQAVGSLGEKRTYVIPNGFTQDLLYYRADWFDAYNEGREKDLARCRTWEEVVSAAEKLQDKGAGLALAGKDRLVDCFDAMVWSAISVGRIADPSAAYFSGVEEGESIYTLEKTGNGVNRFEQVLKTVPEEALNWTQEEALAAFRQGKTAMLLADRSAMEVLRGSMPEGSWAVTAYPRGETGSAVFADEFTGWGAAASSQEPEIAIHFLTFLSNADNNTHYAKECGVLPIHLLAADMEESLTEGDLAEEMLMIKRGDWYQYVSAPTMYRAYDGYREQANEKLRQLVRGELSQKELLDYLNGYWTQAYADEGKLWSDEEESAAG